MNSKVSQLRNRSPYKAEEESETTAKIQNLASSSSAFPAKELSVTAKNSKEKKWVRNFSESKKARDPKSQTQDEEKAYTELAKHHKRSTEKEKPMVSHETKLRRKAKKRQKYGSFTRRLWKDEEDEAINSLVDKYGIRRWTLISKKLQEEFGINGRSGKQCRERY